MAAVLEDWVEAQSHSAALYDTMVCKTPLQGYAVPPGEAWTPTHALRAARLVLGRAPVAVVDLTSGGGFYNRGSRPWGEARYSVIPCIAAGRDAGRDDPPLEDAWHAFWLAMEEARACGGGCIVHCRHGFNRSGWMLCRYAVVAGLAPDARTAVTAFAAARPPGIYKAAYLASLFAALGEAPLERAPEWPHWRRARRVLDSLPPLWREAYGNGPLPQPPLAALQRRPDAPHEVGTLTRWSARVAAADSRLSCACVVRAAVAEACGCGDDTFGGPQPVALRREALPQLRAGYAVSWKADGVRLLVAVLPFGTFGLNRRMEVRYLGDALRSLPAAARRATCPLVFDAELVMTPLRPVLWVYDIMAACGTRLAARPFRARMHECARVVRELRHASPAADASTLRVARKHWWPASTARAVLADPRNAQCDGLVFTRWDAPFVSGLDIYTFKWKHVDRVTVDFAVTETDALLLMDGRPPDAGEALLNPHERWRGSVVECAWCYERAGWLALHARPDKPRGNSRTTYDDTKLAIAERVTEEDVFAAVE